MLVGFLNKVMRHGAERRNDVNGEPFYAAVHASSKNATAHRVRWYSRPEVREHPIIILTDKGLEEVCTDTRVDMCTDMQLGMCCPTV